MEKNLNFPVKNYYNEGSNITVDSNVSILDRGTDPKPLILEFCKPMCVYWKEKLERCESKLAQIIKVCIFTYAPKPITHFTLFFVYSSQKHFKPFDID